MPTREQIGQLEAAAQDILDGHDFGPLKTTVDQIGAGGSDAWFAARLCKTPMAAAFGHLIGSKTIEMAAAGDAPDTPSDLSAFDHYLAMTAGRDEVAGEQIMEEYQASDTLKAAFEYFSGQVKIIRAFEAKNPTLLKRRNRVPVTLTPKEVLISQVVINATDNTPALIVREALRVCLTEGRLPASDELAQKLKDSLRRHSQITSLTTEVFNTLIYGRDLAQRRHRVHQETGSPLPIPKWHTILRQQVEEGTLSHFADETSKPLQNDVESEFDRIASARMLGHCAAQFHLRPRDPQYAARFFENEGVPLVGNKFSMAEYQLLRGLRAAETTLFADPAYRTAFEQIADALREGGWKANAEE